MSNSGKFTDRTPFLSHAGHTSAVEGLSVDRSLRQDLYLQKTSTPDNIKKFRNSTKERIGIKQLHPGIYDDSKVYETYVHGIKTLSSDHVDDCIINRENRGINHFLNHIKENKYASSWREPLGKGLQRNYIFPEKVACDENFRFGVPTVGCKTKFNFYMAFYIDN